MHVDTLWSNVHLITLDGDGLGVIRDGVLACADGRIRVLRCRGEAGKVTGAEFAAAEASAACFWQAGAATESGTDDTRSNRRTSGSWYSVILSISISFQYFVGKYRRSSAERLLLIRIVRKESIYDFIKTFKEKLNA